MAATPLPSSAKDVVKQFLDQYGLGGLTNWAWEQYTGAGGGSVGLQVVQQELPSTPQFKSRFPAYDKLAKEGRAMSPAEMVAYENTAKQMFHAAGLPAGFYDTPDDLAKFMVNDVSVAELEQRVQTAQKATFNTSPETRQFLAQNYGVDSGHLTAYWLDPTVAQPLLENRFAAAQIAGQAATTGYGTLGKSAAEQLASQGVTDQQAQEGFSQLGKEQGLFQAQVSGEDVIDSGAQLAAQFGGNANAQRRIEQRAAGRKAQFAGASGFGTSQQGVTGLGSTQ